MGCCTSADKNKRERRIRDNIRQGRVIITDPECRKIPHFVIPTSPIKPERTTEEKGTLQGSLY